MGSLVSLLCPKEIPPPPSEPTQQRTVRSIYPYEAQTSGDVSIELDDLLEVVDDRLESWLWVRKADGALGYVPASHVQPLNSGPESLDSWFDCDRHEAMAMLLMPGRKPGTYVIRPCKQQSHVAKYTLSLRCNDSEGRPTVKHYMLKQMDNGGFYISPKLTFNGIEDLIRHYSASASGLATQLAAACPREWVPPTQFREFELDRSRVTLGKMLGKGSFGEVYEARLGRNTVVAVKTMMEGAMKKEEFLDEGRTLHRLHHPKIVQLLGVCTKDDPLYIITEFMANGDLKKFLVKDRTAKLLDFGSMVDMLMQVADGMSYLEEKNFVHRDLRAANILVGANNLVKVGDFGLSKFLEDDVYNINNEDAKFPIRWTAPEAARPPYAVSTKSDVWSFGVLAFEVVTRGESPYRELKACDVINQVTAGYRMKDPKVFTVDKQNNFFYDDVMLPCWQKDPHNRLTFASLKNILNDCSINETLYC